MKTPAECADASLGLVMDREAWLDAYSDDAVVFDPVGPSPHDPEGKGFFGKEELGRFWDLALAPLKDVSFVVRERYTGGNEAVTLYTVTVVPFAGEPYQANGIALHELGEDGKIKTMRNYMIPGESNLSS